MIILNNKKHTNKKGLEILQKDNPKENFRISFCKDTNCSVVQVLEKNKQWLCLHD